MKIQASFFRFGSVFPKFLFVIMLLMANSCGSSQAPFDPNALPSPLEKNRNRQPSFDPNALPTLTESRNMVSSTLDLKDVWRSRTGFPNIADNINASPFIFVTKDKVIFSSYGDLTQNKNAYLTALSLSSGEIIWQTTYNDPNYGAHIISAYLNNKTNRLFLMYAFKVASFDLETGQQLWVSKNLGGHTSYIFSYEQGDMLLIDSSVPERITIDPATGQVLSKQATDHQRMTIFRENIKLYNDNTQGFQAVDQNNQTLWVWGDRRGAEFWPSFLDDNDLLAEFGYGGPIYYLARINYRTGQQIWNSAFDIVSNYAVLEKQVFVLTKKRHSRGVGLGKRKGSWFNAI